MKPQNPSHDPHDAAQIVKGGNRTPQPQGREAGIASRGSSIQGELQNAKGAPEGANQGGAPRGGSRVEPSHQKRAEKQSRAKDK